MITCSVNCQEVLAPRGRRCEVAKNMVQELESTGAEVEKANKAKEDSLKELVEMKAAWSFLRKISSRSWRIRAPYKVR